MSRGNSNPLYSRGSLASGAVGVPDVADPSKYLYATGQDMLQASETFFKAEATKRKIAEDIAAEKYKIQWEHEYYTELEKQKQQSQEDPYGLADKAYGMGEKSISFFANNISNPKVRDAFNKKAVSSLGSAQTMVRNWASKQTVDNAYSDTEQALATLYQQAGVMTTPEEFGMLRNQGESLINSAVPIIGIEGADKLRKEMGKQMAENFIYAKIDNNPWTVKKYVDSGMFDDIYDEKELHSINDTARQIIKRNEQEQKEAAEAKAGRDFQILVDKALSGELSLLEINRMIDRERAIKGKGTGQRLSNYMRLKEVAIGTGLYENAQLIPAEAKREVDKIFAPVKETTKRKSKEGKTSKTGEIDYSLKGATYERLVKMQKTLDYNATALTTEFRKMKYETMEQLWDDYFESTGNRYHVKSEKNRSYDIYLYNDGLNSVYNYIDKTVPSKERDNWKKQVAEEYSKRYEGYVQKVGHDATVSFWLNQIDKKINGRGK